MKQSAHHSRTRLAALFVPTALALAACGGSDDEVMAPPAVVPLTLTGTAATGAAIAAGAVDAKCSEGSGSATTQSDGSYRLEIPGAALPCLVKVTKDETVLHSLAIGSGTTATAHVTPVSELVIAHLAGGNPADYFAAFDPTKAPDATKVQAAVATVVATLKEAGVDLGDIDVLAGPLVVAQNGKPGNAFDQALDTLKAKLETAGLKLADLRDSMLRTLPDAPLSALSATASLPAELLLRPSAPNCKALRSGNYRLVFIMPGNGAVATDTAALEAPTLKFKTTSDNETSTLIANGECRYTLPNGGDMVVSQAGVAVLRSLEDGGYRAGIAMPEQKHPLSALAGHWNYMGLGSYGLPWLFFGEMELDRTGTIVADRSCITFEQYRLPECGDTVQNPGLIEPGLAVSEHPQGGFKYDFSRAFAYRAGSGEMMVVAVDGDGVFHLFTRKAPRALPDIGTVSRNWNVTLTSQLLATAAINVSESTTVTHAADGKSYVRDALNPIDGSTHPQTVQIDAPLEGFIYRPAAVAQSTLGATVNISEWFGLPLRGMGLTPVGLTGSNQLILAVTKPAN